MEVEDGRPRVKFELAMEFDVCVKPPTKKDFIDALYRIQGPMPAKHRPDTPIRDYGPTRRWMQRIADEIVKPCKHHNCNRKTVGKFQLVDKCY